MSPEPAEVFVPPGSERGGGELGILVRWVPPAVAGLSHHHINRL